ncbi:pectinesterase protein [Spatholobus suberectus]|nr:pectinesterase protein [Spatholobus suberectus]
MISVTSNLLLNMVNIVTYSPFAFDLGLEVRLLGNLIAKVAKEFSSEILKFYKGTENLTLCVETISSYLDSSFDLVKALKIEINATIEKTKEIVGNIAKLLDDRTTSKKALDTLGICKLQYGDMLDTIKEAVELVPQQNMVDASYKFSSVISDKFACNYAFEESFEVDIPFAQDSLLLFLLSFSLPLKGIWINHYILSRYKKSLLPIYNGFEEGDEEGEREEREGKGRVEGSGVCIASGCQKGCRGSWGRHPMWRIYDIIVWTTLI